MFYKFEVVIIMEKNGDELSIVRGTHKLYHSVIMDLVAKWTKLYRQDGWKIKSIYEQNFEFVEGKDWYEHG